MEIIVPRAPRTVRRKLTYKNTVCCACAIIAANHERPPTTVGALDAASACYTSKISNAYSRHLIGSDPRAGEYSCAMNPWKFNSDKVFATSL